MIEAKCFCFQYEIFKGLNLQFVIRKVKSVGSLLPLIFTPFFKAMKLMEVANQ